MSERDQWTGLTAYMHCEITAEAFRVMTGHMAPYKNASPMAYTGDEDERRAAYDEWFAKYGQCVRAVMHAFKEMRPDYEDAP